MINLPATRILSLFKSLLAVSVVAGMVACGGGGAKGPDTGTPGGGVTPTPGNGGPAPTGTPASSIQVLAATQTIPSSGQTPLAITAVVLDTQNRTITGKAVTFRVTDPSGSAFVSVAPGGVTDASGRITAELNVGNNKTNRAIAVSATADTASASTEITATGTAVTVSGTTSLPFGGSAQLILSVKDSAGVGLNGVPITMSSSKGNTFNPASPTTNASGEATVTVNAAVAGTDSITASALGATATNPLTVSGANFAFAAPSPAINSEILVNTNQTITVHWDEAGVPQIGKILNFSATRGAITCVAACTTNASGDASVTLNSTTTGVSTVTAAGPGGIPSNSLDLVFVTTTATSVSIQANTPTVAVNTGGSATNRATLTAVVRDAANNLVKNARVEFSIIQGGNIGGQLTSGVDITDVSGVANVDYIAGTISSAQNGVVIQAHVTDVNGAPVTVPNQTVQLTVGGQSLFIRLETDNKVAPSPPTYKKTYTAIVTDSAGNGVPNVNVQFKLKPREDNNANNNDSSARAYGKGIRVACRAGDTFFPCNGTTRAGWFLAEAVACDNEDSNFNGILDTGEDLNSSTDLTPGNVASATTNITTNQGGFANTVIEYAQNFADWATVTLEARVSVSGTESVATRTFDLPALASDFTDLNVSPPGDVSPFGIANVCTDKN